MKKNLLQGWARLAGERYREAANMAFSDWFPIWWNNLVQNDKFLLISALIFPLITITISVLILNKANREKYIHTIVFSLITLLGVVFWLLLAPDFRFGKGFIVLAAISPLLILFRIDNIVWKSITKPFFFFHHYTSSTFFVRKR